MIGALLALCASGPVIALAQPAVPGGAPPTTPSAAPSEAPPAAPSEAPPAAPSEAPPAPPSEAPPAAGSAPPGEDEAAAQARKKAVELNRSGAKRYQQREYSACIADFQASLRLSPTRSALTGAGTCLVRLERYDEALDAFEAAVAQYGATMPKAAREQALQQITAMRTVTGGVAVSGAEAGAMIVIDGRVRGEHPTSAPVNALVGSHLVRVYKEGFAVFEQSVEVAKGEVTNVPVKLVPIARVLTGRLKVDHHEGKRMRVLIDGIPVGETPWEGPVTPGEHAVVLQPLPSAAPPPPSSEDDVACNVPRRSAAIVAVAGTEETLASAPITVVVKPNETASVKAKVEPLAGLLRIRPEPATARVFLDGIAIGRGGFEGRAKPGEHTVKVEAEGYFTEARRITVPASGEQILTVTLRKDIQAPIWVAPGHFFAELGAGAAFTPSLGGDLAAGCAGTCRQGVGAGARVALRGGYELGNGFGFGITVGYLDLRQTTTGRETTLYAYVDGAQGPGSPGVADDSISIRHFMVGAHAGLRLGRRLPLRLGLSAGVATGDLTDTRTGIFGSSGIGPVSQSGLVTWFFVEPEVRAGVRITERLGLELGLSALILATPRAPRWSDEMLINPHGNQFGEDAGGELPPGGFAAESVTGNVLFAFTPGLSARYDF